MGTPIIKDLLEKINNPMKEVSIAIIGDFGIDVFVTGSVTRISPEAPIPVLLAEKEDIKLGLAGNVIANLNSLKDKFPTFIDAYGIPDDYLSMNIENYFTLNNTRRTTVKTRFLAGNHPYIRVDEEDTSKISDEDQKRFINYFDKYAKCYDILIIQDYGKGVLTSELTREFIRIAKENNILIITDPNQNSNPYNYMHSKVITPNVKEAEIMLKKIGYGHGGIGDVPYMCQLLKYQLRIDNILITESANGMTLLNEKDEIIKFPALSKDVRDVTGAGDTVVAVLALALANEFSIEEACWIATGAASVVVGKQGTSTVTLDEIKKELKNV